MISIIFGISTTSGTVEYFSNPRLADHIFAIVYIAMVTTLGYGLIILISKLRRQDLVKNIILKTVFISSLIYIPISYFLSSLVTAR